MRPAARRSRHGLGFGSLFSEEPSAKKSRDCPGHQLRLWSVCVCTAWCGKIKAKAEEEMERKAEEASEKRSRETPFQNILFTLVRVCWRSHPRGYSMPLHLPFQTALSFLAPSDAFTHTRNKGNLLLLLWHSGSSRRKTILSTPRGPSIREPRPTRVYTRLKAARVYNSVCLRACHPVYMYPVQGVSPR